MSKRDPGDGTPPATPPKTKTLPESLRGAEYDGPDFPTMLKDYDSDLSFELPQTQRKFTLGSAADCDVSLRDPYISGFHCALERRGPSLRVHDQQTHNGTFFDSRRLDVFDVRPGDTFLAGRTRLLVLNDEMRAAIPVLTDILGSPGETKAPTSAILSSASDVIVAAKEGPNMIIMGEPGCDQERLAETIHAMSLRRNRELVTMHDEPRERSEQRAVIDRASRSTLVIPIQPRTQPMDATFVSLLFEPRYHIRIIALAPSAAETRNVLGEQNVSTMKIVNLAPISQRSGAVPRLLDRMLEGRNSTLRVSDFTPANQGALLAYAWPKNMTALRTAAERFVALASSRSLNHAAKVLDMSTSSLQNWFRDQLDLTWPLVETKAVADDDGP